MARLRELIAGIGLVMLAACSGGAGGNGGTSLPLPPVSASPTPAPAPAPSPPPSGYAAPVPPPPGYIVTPRSLQSVRSAHDTEEFRRNYDAVEMVGGLHALDAGNVGGGVTVGIIDDGALNVADELDGRIDLARSRDFGELIVGGRRTARNAIGDAQSLHGTPIANIIAGAANGANTMGYAPEARLAVLRIDDVDTTTGSRSYTHMVEALDWARATGLRLVNISLSSGANPVFGEAVSRYAQTGGLLILAAGNEGQSEPTDAAAIGAEARNAVLFVVALAPSMFNYGIEPYSNRAGSMADRTVAAPGTNVTTFADGSTSMFSGTSAAAPVVTALAATILSRWPQLSGQEAGDIILATAKDVGAPGPDPVFGRGVVDFAAALSPVAPTLSNGRGSTLLAASVMQLSASLNPDQLRTALSDLVVIDRFGRDFRGSIANRVQAIDPHRFSVGRRVTLAQHSLDTAFRSGRVSVHASVLALPSFQDDRLASLNHGSIRYDLPRERIEISWNSLPGGGQGDLAGLAEPADAILAYAPRAGTQIRYSRVLGPGLLTAAFAGGGVETAGSWAGSLAWLQGATSARVALIAERGSILGAPTGLGSLTLGRGARTVLAEIAQAHHFDGGWGLGGYSSIGLTTIAVDRTSLVTGAGPLITTRFGLRANGPMLGGNFEFGVAQPLSVQSGSVDVTRPIGYDPTLGLLQHAASRVSVGGSRGLQLTLGYSVGGARSKRRLGLLHDREDGATRALAIWRLIL